MQEKVKMVDIINPNKKMEKTPEEKKYLVCIETRSNSKDGFWEILTGRSEVYEYIKNIIDIIDFENSFILVEDCILEERKSIYAFMKYAKKFYQYDDFDIDDYIDDEIEYDNKNIDESINVDKSSIVSMADILNGSISIE